LYAGLLITGPCSPACQSKNFHPCDTSDLHPIQLAAFYRAVGGNYDALFLETEPPALAFVYAKLGCLHSLQPAPSSDGFQPPRTPALKPRGFTKWQSIQLLLMPGEHVPYVQNALRRFDIVDPRTGAAFPRLLPKEAFPSEPDEGLVRWYEDVSNKLRDTGSTSGSEPGGRFRDADVGHVHGDNGYFSNPSFHERRWSAALGRGAARPGPRTPVEFLQERGRAVVSTVRQFLDPRVQAPVSRHVRRRSWHNSADVDDDDDDDDDDGFSARRRAAARRGRDARAAYGTADEAHHDARPPQAHNRHPRRQRSVGSRTPSPGPRPSRRPTGYASPRSGRAREAASPARRGDGFSHAGGDVDDATADGGSGGYDRPTPPRRRSPAHAAAAAPGPPPDMAVPVSAAVAAAGAAATTAAAGNGGFHPSTRAPFAARVAQLAEGGHVHRTGTYSHSPLSGEGTHRRNRSREQAWQRRQEQERERGEQGPRVAIPHGEDRRRRSGERSRSGSRSRSRSRDSGRGAGLREVDRRSRSTDARMLGDGWRRDGGAGRGGRGAAEGDGEREAVGRERNRRRERYVDGVDGRRYPERTWT
jgi:hypothetical protein